MITQSAAQRIAAQTNSTIVNRYLESCRGAFMSGGANRPCLSPNRIVLRNRIPALVLYQQGPPPIVFVIPASVAIIRMAWRETVITKKLPPFLPLAKR